MATFGDILSSLSLGANQSVRRNAADSAFEAFTVGTLASLSTINNSNWSGTALAIANGGTGQTSAGAAFNALSPNTTLGDLTYANGANTNTRLAGNTTTTKKFLTQTGNGTNSAAPGWNTIAMSDLGSGSPSSSNFLRGDGSWQAVSVSPAGSNTQVQYNNGGSFGASANLTFASNALDVGQGRIGEWAGGGTFAAFGHKTALGSSSNNYAVLQSSGGATFFNTAAGTALSFRIANVDKFVVNDGYIGFNIAANSAVALWLAPAASNKFGQIISGLASQSAPLFEVRDVSGNTRFQVGSAYGLQHGYDNSNYWTAVVGSTGGVTFDAVGSGAKFTFSDDVELASSKTLKVGGTQFRGYTTSAASPSTTQLPNDKDWCFHDDTGAVEKSIAINIGGTVYGIVLPVV